VTVFSVSYQEWITSEEGVLRNAYDLLKPGGYFLLTAPAFTLLKRRHDVLAMGKRRYTIPEIELLLNQPGLKKL